MAEARACTQCGAPGRTGAAFCWTCGSALSKPVAARSGSAIPLAPRDGELTVFPWWQVIIFLIISSGVWSFYWFYCTRKQVSGLVETNRDDPGTQTFGYMIPIWQVFVVRDLWRDIDGVAQRAGTMGINAKSYATWFWICSYIPIVNYVGWIVILVFYVNTQSRLMEALRALNGGVNINRRVTPWSAVWAFGLIVLYFVLSLLP